MIEDEDELDQALNQALVEAEEEIRRWVKKYSKPSTLPILFVQEGLETPCNIIQLGEQTTFIKAGQDTFMCKLVHKMSNVIQDDWISKDINAKTIKDRNESHKAWKDPVA